MFVAIIAVASSPSRTMFSLCMSWRAKTLDRRLCTDRSGEAVVIFLFGLEALLTRDSRVLSCVVSSSPKL